MMSTGGSDENDLGFLLQGMRRGAIGTVAMKDGLILKLGTHLTRKLGNNKEQHGYIRSHMRHLGRLLIHLRAKTGSQASELHDFIHPTKFRLVVDAAQGCAGFDDTSHSYSTPSSAIRSGQLLKKVAQLNMAHALEMGNTATVDASTQFLKLCDLQWSEVAASAHRNLSERSRNGVDFLPLTADVMKLSKCLTEEGKKNAAILNDEQGGNKSEAYTERTQVTLAKLTLFNRKRQGEVAKLTVTDWSEKKKAVADNELENNLNEFEKHLIQVLERLEIRGKRGRIVPILITEEVAEWVQILLKRRSQFVAGDNPYLFANSCNFFHHGSDVMRKFASLSGAQRPHLLTTTKLRKHVASLAQVLALKENEMDMLASFLGHDLRVHREFYRMPLDVLQVARVSKVFLACEEGRISEFAGKGLSEITMDDDEIVYLEDADEDDSSDEQHGDDHCTEPCSTMEKPEETSMPKKRIRYSDAMDWRRETFRQDAFCILYNERSASRERGHRRFFGETSMA